MTDGVLHGRIKWKLIAQMFVLSLIVFGLQYNFPWIYKETFVWQMTTLGEVLRPVHRTGCDIPTSSNGPAQPRRKLNIGVVMMYGKMNTKASTENTWNDELMIPVLRNREEYCARHNYTMINAKDLIDPTRPISWSKLIALDHHFSTGKYDYLFYIDMDMVIMDFSVPLERFIEADNYEHDFIITKDWIGINFGVWIAKYTPWTLWFLRTAWNQTQLIPDFSEDGKRHPFDYEQRAVHYLLDTKTWQQSGLKRYPGNSTEIRSHFKVLPQCAFNSYTVHPLDFRGDRDYAQYRKGDFIVHFAGKRGYKKIKLMEHYLKHVDRGERAQRRQLAQHNLRLNNVQI